MNSRWMKLAAIAEALTIACCGGDYNEMTIAVEGMRAAVGSWNPPALVTLVIYAPRPGGASAPVARFPDPAWDSSRDERRIVAWNGEDRMLFPVAWPRGTITEIRIQAVVATGRCGSVRSVIAEGERRGIQWSSTSDPGVTISMQPRPQTVGVEEVERGEGCR
jgi:hypothetical protein